MKTSISNLEHNPEKFRFALRVASDDATLFVTGKSYVDAARVEKKMSPEFRVAQFANGVLVIKK